MRAWQCVASRRCSRRVKCSCGNSSRRQQPAREPRASARLLWQRSRLASLLDPAGSRWVRRLAAAAGRCRRPLPPAVAAAAVAARMPSQLGSTTNQRLHGLLPIQEHRTSKYWRLCWGTLAGESSQFCAGALGGGCRCHRGKHVALPCLPSSYPPLPPLPSLRSFPPLLLCRGCFSAQGTQGIQMFTLRPANLKPVLLSTIYHIGNTVIRQLRACTSEFN